MPALVSYPESLAQKGANLIEVFLFVARLVSVMYVSYTTFLVDEYRYRHQ